MGVKSFDDYYEVLEVHRKASHEVIEKAYKILAKRYHPDLNPKNLSFATEMMIKLNEAYSILGDLEKREKYNMLYDSLTDYPNKGSHKPDNKKENIHDCGKSNRDRNNTDSIRLLRVKPLHIRLRLF